MNLEKKQQAKNLYFQTGMNNTQIANLLNVSRRTISYWVKEGNWERLRQSATHMPSLLAENCYHIFGHLTEGYLSERRITNPVTHKEIDGLHKLASTINKLKNRATLNESMEMFGFFLDGLRQRNPRLAEELTPYIEEYISSRAEIYAHHVAPPQLTGIGGRFPWLSAENTEQQRDAREQYFCDPDVIAAYERAGMELPTEEEI
ncbi:MAG: hypothetical protein JWQ38_2542, partial [Flavipsychrobacter sp.]|nr:hypothetical protein [Flavipsychrobacter sp.]